MKELSETEQRLIENLGFSRSSKTIALLTKFVESVGNDLTRVANSRNPVMLYTWKQLAKKLGVREEDLKSPAVRGWLVDPRTVEIAEFAPSFVNRLAWDDNVIHLSDEKVRENNPIKYYMGRAIGTRRRGCLPHEGLIVYRYKNGAIYAVAAGFNIKKGRGMVNNSREQIKSADNLGLLNAASLKLLPENVVK